MELLAPAGSKEALVAAIEAGADAVYAGLQDFNARRNAKNLSFHDIQVLSDYIHTRGRRLYITLNILLKESEISSLFQLLEGLADLSIDGLIIQDLGLALLSRRYFPHIPLHASTQMAIHNSYGVRFLQREGFSRVILARELSIEEIAQIHRQTSMELEVFAHGALCYSLSGLCLASSAIGGHSGNRGLCTQPCRRPVIKKDRKGYFFSTLDLEAIKCLGRLEEAGVRAIKIEGRMKSVSYITTVVKAYRRALDCLENMAELPGGTDIGDFSRDKTIYYLAGLKGDIVNPGKPGVSGLLAGTVEDTREGKAIVCLSRDIHAGDRLRILDETAHDTSMVNIKPSHPESTGIAKRGEHYEISCDFPVKKGSLLFISGTTSTDDFKIKESLDNLYRNYRGTRSRHSGKKWGSLAGSFSLPPIGKQSPLPSVRCDDWEWLHIIARTQVDDIIISLEMLDSVESSGHETLKSLKPQIIVDLPLFISPAEEDSIKQRIHYHVKKGFKRWMVENPGHLEMMGNENAEIIGGPFLYTLNSLAISFLARRGIQKSISPLEDEFFNMRAVLKKRTPRKITLFSFIPCFITRALTASFFREDELIRSSGLEYFIRRKDCLTFIISRKPYAIFQYREKLTKAGNCEYLIDLSFTTPSIELWRRLLEHFKDGTSLPGSYRFNFKRGLK